MKRHCKWPCSSGLVVVGRVILGCFSAKASCACTLILCLPDWPCDIHAFVGAYHPECVTSSRYLLGLMVGVQGHTCFGFGFVQGYGCSTLTSFPRHPGRLRVLCPVANRSTSRACHTLLCVAHALQLSVICFLLLYCFLKVPDRPHGDLQHSNCWLSVSELNPAPCLQESATAHHAS